MGAGGAVGGRCALTIIPSIDGYELSVSVENAGNRMKARSCDLQFVRTAVDKVQERINTLIEAINPDLEYESHQMARICDELRAAGRELAEALFADQLPTFEQLLASNDVEQISLTPIGAVDDLPIEFCVLRPVGGEVYLGELATVLRIFVGTKYPEEARKLVPELPGAWRPIYAEDGELGSSCQDIASPQPHEEITALRPIAGNNLMRLSVLETLKRAEPAREQDAFSRWIAEAQDVIHFNSEATQSGLRVRELADVTREDFRSLGGAGLTQGMIVFLNACRSAINGIRVEGSLAVEFWRAGAETVACTTWTVDDAASTAFVRAFYKELSIAGATAAKAMLAARRQVNVELGHPMANLFTLIGNPNYTLSVGERQ